MSVYLSKLFDSEVTHDVISHVDSSRLEFFIADNYEARVGETDVTTLRVAAISSLRDSIGLDGVEGFLRASSFEGVDEDENFVAKWNECFTHWSAFIEALISRQQEIRIEDVLFLSSSGLISNRLSELKILLSEEKLTRVVDETINHLDELPWEQFVMESICCALIKLVTQKNRDDVLVANQLIQAISDKQKDFEKNWLSEEGRLHDSGKAALLLLGLYHVAQSVIRTSDYLITGFVDEASGRKKDFSAELRRLLIKSEEFFTAYGDLDYLFWIEPIAAILWRLYSNSIWTSAYGMSDLMNRFVSEFTVDEREQQFFSLLPSQKDALKQHLLDPNVVAAVLQMPTSAGKTLLAEFSIIQTLNAYGLDARVVYLTPTRALATQIKQTLMEDIGGLGIQVTGISSAFEEDPYELNLLHETSGVIVTTPEKLDLMLRSQPDWFASIRLIIVDEAHLIKDGERGVRLELLLANIRRDYAESKLLLLTPFVENAKEIANWLARDRGASITVNWRPSRILLGCSNINRNDDGIEFSIDWKEPHSIGPSPNRTVLSRQVNRQEVNSSRNKVNYLANRFKKFGSALGMFPGSPVQAEISAQEISMDNKPLVADELNPYLRMAIALAKAEYGEGSILAECLSRGVAFHHSSLSGELRYLIENQVKNGVIRYCAATTTLAQGMNFPVASVIVHSVSLPWGKKLSSGEFWNIAGRAGRVGHSDKGLVVFANPDHRKYWEKYSLSLSEPLNSALLNILDLLDQGAEIKSLYRECPELRPFIQYFFHAVATKGADVVLSEINELIEGSLANAQVSSARDARKLRRFAESYVQSIVGKQEGYLKVTDSTGLGSFSFDELYGRIKDDPLLTAGPREILQNGEIGFTHLISALMWLPELDLSFDINKGVLSPESVAAVVQGWIDGRPIHELSSVYRDEDENVRIRRAGKYVFGKVSQTISWGTHAYLKAASLANKSLELTSKDMMLPAYVQFGVKTPEATLASVLGIPRQFAEAIGGIYREEFGELTPDKSVKFREFIESADLARWRHIVGSSLLVNEVDPADAMLVVKKMQGL